MKVNSPDLLVTSTNRLDPRMIVITPHSMPGMNTGSFISCPLGRWTAPNGRMPVNAPSNSATTAVTPTITDFFAWIFSSSARHNTMAPNSPVNR